MPSQTNDVNTMEIRIKICFVALQSRSSNYSTCVFNYAVSVVLAVYKTAFCCFCKTKFGRTAAEQEETLVFHYQQTALQSVKM